MSPHAYTEDQLVEQPAIGLFAELGWRQKTQLPTVRQHSGRRRWSSFQGLFTIGATGRVAMPAE
jgi:hypothetical protein